MDAKIKERLGKSLTTEELEKVEAFLNRGFNSLNAQIVISSIFMYAKESGKSVAEVLVECEKEWTRNWNFQHPDMRGDTTFPGGAGKQSIVSLRNIYNALGIPTPEQAEKAIMEKIPKGAFVVKTRNSSYYFGEDEGDGVRSVSTDSLGSGLLKDKCQITLLIIGRGMEFDYWPKDGKYCETTAVQSIKPA
ncbi:MAG: hypothetical protein WC386_00985 [Candidatus Paceibacterota bacterium]|jgi:hypothetical protein